MQVIKNMVNGSACGIKLRMHLTGMLKLTRTPGIELLRSACIDALGI